MQSGNVILVLFSLNEKHWQCLSTLFSFKRYNARLCGQIVHWEEFFGDLFFFLYNSEIVSWIYYI